MRTVIFIIKEIEIEKPIFSILLCRSRLTTEGLAFDQPVADNSTAEGRAQNRRVEIYITANADMIKKAESGQLN